MADYQARRLENIRRNKALVTGLGMRSDLAVEMHKTSNDKKKEPPSDARSTKRRKVQSAPRPTRVSARIANAPSKPTYAHDDTQLSPRGSRQKRAPARSPRKTNRRSAVSPTPSPSPTPDASDPSHLETLHAGWTSWAPSAPPPTLTQDSELGDTYYHFASHPDFRPNKSPESIIREGAFGGTYYRPLYSKKLRTTISEDWQRDLPEEWTRGLDVSRYLTSEEYDKEINKYGVACGQSIEAWEASGWIAHEYDVRGWFQWYCRFWRGRRVGDEDDRQVARWKKCVGEKGRWRRTLLKKYVQLGIRTVTDEDGEAGDGEEERPDVSPVVHQTCHHWAWEVRQDALDRFWEEG